MEEFWLFYLPVLLLRDSKATSLKYLDQVLPPSVVYYATSLWFFSESKWTGLMLQLDSDVK